MTPPNTHDKNYPYLLVRILCAILAAVAIAPLPYAYYRILRAVVFCGGSWATFREWENRPLLALAFAAIVILFNPIYPMRFDRSVWQVLDGVATAVFLFSVLKRS